MIFDCSRKLKADMTVYPGDPLFELRWVKTPNGERSVTQSSVSMGMHSGTHVDAPLHFVPTGEDLDGLPLDRWIGPCRLIEIAPEFDQITLELLLPHEVQRGEILLFKTQNSELPEDAPFTRDYVTLNPAAARHLVECGVKTIGVDYLSIDGKLREGIHQIILGAGIAVIEGLYFKDVPAGNYFLSALPLRIKGAEGSPVRAVLLSQTP